MSENLDPAPTQVEKREEKDHLSKIRDVADRHILNRQEFIDRLEKNIETFDGKAARLRENRVKRMEELSSLYAEFKKACTEGDGRGLSDICSQISKKIRSIENLDSAIAVQQEKVDLRKAHAARIRKNISKYLGHVSRWSKEIEKVNPQSDELFLEFELEIPEGV